jgi:hypothetical protein
MTDIIVGVTLVGDVVVVGNVEAITVVAVVVAIVVAVVVVGIDVDDVPGTDVVVVVDTFKCCIVCATSLSIATVIIVVETAAAFVVSVCDVVRAVDVNALNASGHAKR